jgi:glycosyltransferase involved in cell wall biosynthesis
MSSSPRRPRIAVVSSYCPTREEPYRGHSAYQTLRRMHPWAELHAFCPLPVYPAWIARHLRRFRYRRMDLNYSPPDLAAAYFEYPALPWLTRPFNGELCFRSVWPAVARFAPDLILNYWLYPDGYAAVRCAARLGVPVVVCGLGSDLRRLDDTISRYWTRYTLRRATYVLAVSHELTQRAIHDFGAPPDRTRAILNGYDEVVFHPGDRLAARTALGLPADAELILYAGSLIPSKGLRELLEAFCRLAGRRPRLYLSCLGEGPLRAELEERARRAGLDPRLLLPGACSSSQVQQWMVAANLFCLPSYSEGCPNVVIEALACGRPVVASQVGGIPELVRPDNGCLAPPRNVPALTEALEAALARSWDDSTVAATYRRSWTQVAEETWQLCQSLLPSPAHPRPSS